MVDEGKLKIKYQLPCYTKICSATLTAKIR